VLELAVEEGPHPGPTTTSAPSNLLLGLIREGEGVAAKVLIELGVDRKRVREETLKGCGRHALGPRQEGERRDAGPEPVRRDLTQLAREASSTRYRR